MIFPPTFILVQLFRRSKSKQSRASKLEKKLESIKFKNKSKDEYIFDRKECEKKKQKTANKKKKILFPWWFKIIAYILSFVFASISLFFIIIQGITFGDDKCSKWITSLVVSFITSILLTQPVKVILITFFLVAVFRKSDDDNELGEIDSNENVLNDWKSEEDDLESQFEKNKHNLSDEDIGINQEDLKEIKAKKIKLNNAKKLLNELVFNSVFLFVLFFVSYTNKDVNSFNYKSSIESLIINDNYRKIVSVGDVWYWLTKDFTLNLKQNELFENFGNKNLKDNVSILIGYPILRQLRVKNSK
jgi:hypothetical protein